MEAASKNDIRNDGLIVLPARRGLTRLPDKLLLSETGKPVLAHTVERALEATGASDRVWVCTDDDELAKIARNAGGNAVLVTEPCASGTERIWRALPQLPRCSVILNLQADEPEMPVDWILDCMAACAAGADCQVATVAVALAADDSHVDDPNAVKVVFDHAGAALYFSRAAIPFVRQGGRLPEPRAHHHMGIYAYSTDFLRRYPSLPASDLEQSECLEQLRFLQAGAKIRVLVKPMLVGGIAGIDTHDDYREFCRRIARHGKRRAA